jgi:hypothetical protein
VIPRDIEGLTIVEARHPSDRREYEETAHVETPDTGITQGWLMFEDVFAEMPPHLEKQRDKMLAIRERES